MATTATAIQRSRLVRRALAVSFQPQSGGIDRARGSTLLTAADTERDDVGSLDGGDEAGPLEGDGLDSGCSVSTFAPEAGAGVLFGSSF